MARLMTVVARLEPKPYRNARSANDPPIPLPTSLRTELPGKHARAYGLGMPRTAAG